MPLKNSSLYLFRPKKILSILGVWPPPNNHVILRRTWTFFSMFTQHSFLFFEFIYIGGVITDLNAVAEASCLLFAQASLCFKATAFIVQRANLLKLLDIMDSSLFEPKSAEHEKILTSHAAKIKYLCLFFMTSAVSTCTLWGVLPLLSPEPSYPFQIWMPVSPTLSPYYELGYLYQMISIYISALLFIGVDSVAITLIMFGCAQLEIIMDKIKKAPSTGSHFRQGIRHAIMALATTPKYWFLKTTVQNVPFSAKRNKKREDMIKSNYEILIECVKQHQLVEQFIQLVENAYHANIFFQLVVTVGLICSIGFRITVVDHRSVQYFSMVNYMVTMLSQLFLFCWCGNELTIRCEELRDWLYQCPWYEQDIKFCRSLWIAMERMKQPIIFKAGHYIPLSRPTFVSILRCSYSYFAVLNSMDGE